MNYKQRARPEKPRILRIINRLNLGGPTYNAAYLSKYLAPEFETLLISGMKDESEASSEFIVKQLGLEPLYLTDLRRELNIISDYKAYREIRKLIREFKPDIVHTHAAKPGTVGRLAAIHEKVPVVVHTFHGHVFHSYFGSLKTKFFLAVERYIARRSTAIIAISQMQKDELADKYRICSPEKIKIVPLGFDLSRFRVNQEELRKEFRLRYNLADDTVAIGIVGRLVPVKNHTLFIKAIKRLKETENKRFHAFIIGDGEDREVLETLCMNLGLNYNKNEESNDDAVITFTSWIRNVEWALAGLDIIALTSFNEGTPVSLIEAQAAGKPVVTTDVGGIRDVVIKDETAFIVQSGDENGFAQKLSLLINDSALRNSMSLKGWPFVKERFHYERLIRDFRLLYEQLLLTKQS